MNTQDSSAKRFNTRRDFITKTGAASAALTLAGAAASRVHAAEDNEIRIALVGCGGRGTGAASNALAVNNGPMKMVAMADVFPDKLQRSHKGVSRSVKNTPEKFDVPEERQFIGFDGYKKAMDALRPGDVVILATPPAFRWVHYTYAIEKGLNVFMEKPVTIDGPTSKRMLDLNKKAKEKNLKAAVGLMCRHCLARQELFDRIKDGAIGDIDMLRVYRMAGPTGSAACPPKPEGMSDLMYQISRFHGFLWLSGGAVSDFLIHNIDEGCWMKDSFPVEAKASGGRHYREDTVDQNFDTYSIEYTFGDGTKMFVGGRTIPGCHKEFASYAHGSKGLAVISSAGHAPSRARYYNGHNESDANLAWRWKDGKEREPNPYQLEWNDLIAAIREDREYNEVDRGVMSSAVTSMGRMSAHTGQTIGFEQFLNEGAEFAPGIEKLTLDSPSPLKPNDDGTYPIPMPGIMTKQEYMIS